MKVHYAISHLLIPLRPTSTELGNSQALAVPISLIGMTPCKCHYPLLLTYPMLPSPRTPPTLLSPLAPLVPSCDCDNNRWFMMLQIMVWCLMTLFPLPDEADWCINFVLSLSLSLFSDFLFIQLCLCRSFFSSRIKVNYQFHGDIPSVSSVNHPRQFHNTTHASLLLRHHPFNPSVSPPYLTCCHRGVSAEGPPTRVSRRAGSACGGRTIKQPLGLPVLELITGA